MIRENNVNNYEGSEIFALLGSSQASQSQLHWWWQKTRDSQSATKDLMTAQLAAWASCSHGFPGSPKSYGGDAEVGPGGCYAHSALCDNQGTWSLRCSQSSKGTVNKPAQSFSWRGTLSLLSLPGDKPALCRSSTVVLYINFLEKAFCIMVCWNTTIAFQPSKTQPEAEFKRKHCD